MIKSTYAAPIIRNVLKDVYDIRRPDVTGTLKSVFIAETPSGKYVCKFNHPNLAVKNIEVSKIMLRHGICVPDIKIYNCGIRWLEVYPIIPGKTLYESVCLGLPKKETKLVYTDIVDTFARMDKIDIAELKAKKYRSTHSVAKTNISDTNNSLIATIFSGAVYLANHGANSDIGLYHCGITTKNTILNADGKFVGLIDLDEVAVSDRSYAFAMMAAKYQQLGYDLTELIDYYEHTTKNKLNHKKIKIIAELVNAGKLLLFRDIKKKQR